MILKKVLVILLLLSVKIFGVVKLNQTHYLGFSSDFNIVSAGIVYIGTPPGFYEPIYILVSSNFKNYLYDIIGSNPDPDPSIERIGCVGNGVGVASSVYNITNGLIFPGLFGTKTIFGVGLSVITEYRKWVYNDDGDVSYYKGRSETLPNGYVGLLYELNNSEKYFPKLVFMGFNTTPKSLSIGVAF